MPGFSNSFKRVMPMEVYPIVAIISFAMGCCGYHLLKLARGPEVVLARTNTDPWNKNIETHGKYYKNDPADVQKIR